MKPLTAPQELPKGVLRANRISGDGVGRVGDEDGQEAGWPVGSFVAADRSSLDAHYSGKLASSNSLAVVHFA